MFCIGGDHLKDLQCLKRYHIFYCKAENVDKKDINANMFKNGLPRNLINVINRLNTITFYV